MIIIVIYIINVYITIITITIRMQPTFSIYFQAIDPDSSENSRLRYYMDGRVQETLSENLDNIRRSPFVVDPVSGIVKLNFDPQKGMKGYFDFKVELCSETPICIYCISLSICIHMTRIQFQLLIGIMIKVYWESFYFFQVYVNDSSGYADRARVFIYLLREDQRVRFILRQSPEEVRRKREIYMVIVTKNTLSFPSSFFSWMITWDLYLIWSHVIYHYF